MCKVLVARLPSSVERLFSDWTTDDIEELAAGVLLPAKGEGKKLPQLALGRGAAWRSQFAHNHAQPGHPAAQGLPRNLRKRSHPSGSIPPLPTPLHHIRPSPGLQSPSTHRGPPRRPAGRPATPPGSVRRRRRRRCATRRRRSASAAGRIPPRRPSAIPAWSTRPACQPAPSMSPSTRRLLLRGAAAPAHPRCPPAAPPTPIAAAH